MRVKINVAIKEHFIKADCMRDADTMKVTYSLPAKNRVELSRKDFISEVRRLGSIDHPNVVKVNEVFEANNTAYYVMELLEGQSLKDYVTQRGCLTVDETMSILRPVIDAVGFLHTNHITHLDIKPVNIMLTTDDHDHPRPVLIDFGLSKHFDEDGCATSTINIQGYSEGYAPIEQYTGFSYFNPPADVYALAATILFSLTGQQPPQAVELPNRLDTILATFNAPRHLKDALKNALGFSRDNRTPDIPAFLRSISPTEISDTTTIPSAKTRPGHHPPLSLSPESVTTLKEQSTRKPDNPPVPSKKLLRTLLFFVCGLIITVAAVVVIHNMKGGGHSETYDFGNNTGGGNIDSAPKAYNVQVGSNQDCFYDQWSLVNDGYKLNDKEGNTYLYFSGGLYTKQQTYPVQIAFIKSNGSIENAIFTNNQTNQSSIMSVTNTSTGILLAGHLDSQYISIILHLAENNRLIGTYSNGSEKSNIRFMRGGDFFDSSSFYLNY